MSELTNRAVDSDKVPVEDFARFAELRRDTKYHYGMEKVVGIPSVGLFIN